MLRRSATTTAVAAAIAALAVPAVAQAGDDNRNQRAEQAPGYFCKQQGAEPRTQEFRDCVRLAAKARRQAENGDQSGGNPNAHRRGALGRFCQSGEDGADPRSEAFRDCVRTAAKARRAARA